MSATTAVENPEAGVSTAVAGIINHKPRANGESHSAAWLRAPPFGWHFSQYRVEDVSDISGTTR
jgi:hypothetical protein